MERDEEIVEVDLKLDMPDFKTEAEEAAWWPTQEEALGKAFEEAAKNGTLRRAHYTLKGATPTTYIRLDPADIELAKKQAESKGMLYQTYLKMIIHEALQRAD